MGRSVAVGDLAALAMGAAHAIGYDLHTAIRTTAGADIVPDLVGGRPCGRPMPAFIDRTGCLGDNPGRVRRATARAAGNSTAAKLRVQSTRAE